MQWKIYLAGEIHSNWREELTKTIQSRGIEADFYGPVTDHPASDDCGVHILGQEEQAFWKDRKGAGLNAIRTRTLIDQANIVIVRFGEKYRQWNAAFDAGYAAALGKPLIIVQPPEFDHALKEVNEAASAVARTNEQVADILTYVCAGKLRNFP
ncbi:MAG: YtoQ family protein [Balneolales bacterium]|nr:YtoQ family protein [Balneolales bacterium]